MNAIEASAPGKAVISGEYAVLGGAPALSMAVNRRARVLLEPGAGPRHSLAAPGYVDGRLDFRAVRGGGIEWLDPLPFDGAFRLFECIWRRAGVEPDGALSIALDTRAFFDVPGGQKLGLGSSAALAVATSAALDHWFRKDDSVRAVASDAHNTFQRGKGSGVDVATAFHGGLIRFQRACPSGAVRWPDGLDYRYFWSGRTVNTTDKLGGLDNMPADGRDRALFSASERVVQKMREGPADEIVDVMRAYVDALAAFDQGRNLGIFAAGHEQLTRYAQSRADMVYKPCGAGGGDIGVALAAAGDVLDEFAMVANQHDFVELDTRFELQGVVVETLD